MNMTRTASLTDRLLDTIRTKVAVAGVGVPYLAAIAAVAAIYVGLAELGFSFASTTKQVSAVWPPAGIAVAVLLLFGYRMWPAVWLGAFVSNAISQEPLLTASGIATGNTLGPVLGVYLMQRVGFDRRLERVRDVFALVLLGSVLATAVNATNGVVNLALSGIVPWAAFGAVWWVWWAGDAMGVLLVTSFVIAWAAPLRRFDTERRTPLEAIALAAAVVAVAWVCFLSKLPMAYPVYPIVIWAALRFGQRGTTLTLITIAALAVWGAAHGLGPFRGGPVDLRLMLLMTFLAIVATTGLVLGAVTAERKSADADLREAQHALRRREAQLEAAERRFQILAESVPQMVWTADATGWIDWYNHRWYEYTGQTREDAEGWGWQRAHHSEDLSDVMRDWARSIATGEPFNMELRIRGADETFRWFLMRAEPLRDASGSIVRWYGTHTDIDEQKRALDKTMLVADTLAAAFLPDRLPERQGLRFDALYLTAGNEALVGGDWYDAFELPDRRIVVSIGDVIGHGIGAAVTAGRIRQGIFATAFDTADPVAILAKVDRMLRFQEQTLATALVAVIDEDLRTLRYASAGHPPPIIAGPKTRARLLPYGGTPLGVGDAPDYHTQLVALERNGIVLFYTDGVTEFRREIESAERDLLRAVDELVRDEAAAHPAKAIQEKVMGSFPPADDAVLMVMLLTSVKAAASDDDSRLRKAWTFHSSDAYSAHATRHELMDFIGGFVASGDALFRAELVLGELLANTVEHAPGLVRIEIEWTAEQPVVTVHDTGPGLSRLAVELPVEDLAEAGRGLFLITTLAKSVQVECEPDRGTAVVVVLDLCKDDAPLPAATAHAATAGGAEVFRAEG